VIHINGYTQPSLSDLHKLVVSHHGGFLQYLDGKTMVTHVIASNLTPKKAVEFKKYRIVKPAWIVDSVKAGHLLPWTSYKVIDEGPNQRTLGFSDGTITSQKQENKTSYRDQSDTSWYANELQKMKESGISSQAVHDKKTSSQSNLEDDILDDEAVERSKPPTAKPIVPTFQDNETSVKKSTPTPDEFDVSFDEGLLDLVAAEELNEPKIQPSDPPQTRTEMRKSPDIIDNLESSAKRAKLTAEEHNAELLADPNVRKMTVVDPGFLAQYYSESRLHHLSTWKSDLNSEMQSLINHKSASQRSRQKPPAGSRRYILHVDFDCFFAAIALKKNPKFKDKPVVVAHGGGSGSEIASCNYVARKFGVKNGMWMKKAKDLCSDLTVFPYDFPAYEEASRLFYEQIIKTGGLVQSVSVDEALVDITTLVLGAAHSDGVKRLEDTLDREQSEADQIALKLRQDVKDATECDVSVGIGGNILLAKLALRKAKPAGQYQILPEDILDFIGPLEIQDLPGVAGNIGSKLEQIGVNLIKDAREISKEKLITTLGPKTGEKIWEYARGIDRKEVGDVEIRKSVSAEINWGVRFENQAQVEEFIESLCEELRKRLLKENVKGKQLTLKVMKRSADAPLDPPKHLGHGLCDSFSKSVVLGVASNQQDIIKKETLSMLKSLRISPGELRGIGVQMTRLEPLKGLPNDDGSQKLIQFKSASTRKPKVTIEDPIEDIITPKKRKVSAEKIEFGAQELNELTPSRKPLNTMGTQFILPTQFDPKVLSELPSDIRSKLMNARSKQGAKPITPEDLSSDGFPSVFTALPNKSQIDPETFKALPEDMQNEIMAFYDNDIDLIDDSDERVQRTKSVEPRMTPSKPKPVPPRRRGRPAKNTTLTQSNFITSHFRKTTPDTGSGSDTKSAVKSNPNPAPELTKLPKTVINVMNEIPYDPMMDIDQEYLAALPKELRAEALAAHRQQHIRAKNMALKEFRKQADREAAKNRPPPPVYHLPPRPNRPTFTMARLSTLSDLRQALTEWVKEFEQEGPYEEDVLALARYLEQVVEMEGNMEKAVACVRWLAWVVEDKDGNQFHKGQWGLAVDKVSAAVQDAVKKRGLGRVKF
jgi:DNA repair protein REV1